MIKVKDKLEGSHQMATFSYQSGVMMSENSAKYDAYREFTEHFPYDTKRLASSQQRGCMIIMASFRKHEGDLCIVMCL